MAVVYGVIFAFIAAFFAIPAMFPAMAPDRKKALSWAMFRMRGIHTATGRSSAGEATASSCPPVPDLLLRHGNCRNRDDRQLTH